MLAAPGAGARRPWFAAALALCLAGDVLLLPQVDRFRLGLAAFLTGHLAFISGLLTQPLHPAALLIAVPVLAVVAVLVAPPVLRAAPAGLRGPITAYIAVILSMAAAAALTLNALAVAGAALFVLSDSLLAWNRFVGSLPRGRLAVIVTYHLAIGALTASLAF